MKNLYRFMVGAIVAATAGTVFATDASAQSYFYPHRSYPAYVNPYLPPPAVFRRPNIVERILTHPAVIAPSYVRTTDLDDYYEDLEDRYKDMREDLEDYYEDLYDD